MRLMWAKVASYHLADQVRFVRKAALELIVPNFRSGSFCVLTPS